MEPRERVERLISRMYEHHLRTTGNLPADALKRKIEKKAQYIAQRADRKRRDNGQWR